jgi:hypothetical protein
MQSKDWSAKTLQNAAGFWTEIRHAEILYSYNASYAEGGGPIWGKVPEPPRSYIEPQPVMYRRLRYLADRLRQGLEERGFSLLNMGPLKTYIAVMDDVIAYSDKELANALLVERIDEEKTPDGAILSIIKQSDWEYLRKGLIDDLADALPRPVEGPELQPKDKRAAVVVDVLTGGDKDHPIEVLYEGTGAPYVILTAVKDANGPRLAIGFTYSQFEFREKSGGKRLTDEQWQERFYKDGDNPENPFDYSAPATWPPVNPWFVPLFESQ